MREGTQTSTKKIKKIKKSVDKPLTIWYNIIVVREKGAHFELNYKIKK